MIEVRKLQVNEEAVTPKGHRIVVVGHLDNRTIVKVVESQKELDIPSWQLVTPLKEPEGAPATLSAV